MWTSEKLLWPAQRKHWRMFETCSALKVLLKAATI